jgi:DNA-binding MarR family transcriptional regulator
MYAPEPPRQGPSEVADALHGAAIRLLRRARKVDPASGLGPAQLSVLSVLVFGGRTTIGGLADAEQVSAPTVSRIVTSLERLGLVQRVAGSDDRRTVLVEATASGEDLMQRARARRVEDIARRLTAVAPADLALLGDAARVLRRALEE